MALVWLRFVDKLAVSKSAGRVLGEKRLGKVVGLGRKAPQLAESTADYVVPTSRKLWSYIKVEMRPPTPAELPQISRGLYNITRSTLSGKWKQSTMKESAINALVCFEIVCWFFVGECIGKGTLIGYQVPGAVHFEHEM